MKEKERYEVIYNEDELGYCIIDTEEDLSDDMHNFNIIADLLNQQDKRMKELESKLRVTNSLNASLSLDYNELKKRYDSQEKLLTRKLAEYSILTLENQQLKQLQKQVLISVLEDVMSIARKGIDDY